MNIIGEKPDSFDDVAKEHAKFLERDFTQCFLQMRHYDAQSVEICKFAFTAYSAAIVLAFALYRYGLTEKTDYHIPVASVLSVGFFFGLCFVAFLARNRAYFVIVTRYINEHRRFFLEKRPLGFANHVKMYTDLDKPPYFHWRSSQALLLYVMAGLNGFMAASAAHFFWFTGNARWEWVSGIGGGVFVLQLLFAICFLRSRENKSAEKAVFAKEKQ